MNTLLSEIRSCKVCDKHLENGCNPVLSAHKQSKIIIIGQAPGIKVHKSDIPWDDKSGDNLREWMGIAIDTFYDPQKIALIPMGFCYPGKGKTGDLPPRPECAPLWHKQVLYNLTHVKLILLIGKFAQEYYINDRKRLTERVKNYKNYLPKYFTLPHPSPRNNIWMKKNSWFKKDVIPELKKEICNALN